MATANRLGTDPYDAASTCGDVVALMLRVETYPEAPRAVAHRETHLSHVFLTDRFAYKLLKPVAFGFVDFSTLERRKAECQSELALNRRMAPDVYLDTMPITRAPSGSLQMGGDGEVIEWVIQMQRLDDDRSLEALVGSRRITSADLDALANMLTNFYANTKPAPVDAESYINAIARHVRDNRAELLATAHGLPVAMVKKTHAAQLVFLATAHDELAARVSAGHVVEGHGDLRPEHIYFTPQPVAIDCLAFSRDLRTLDTADEMAFLTMELERLGARGVSDHLVVAYGSASHDTPSPQLWAFYKCYRACVRAKVAALRAAQLVVTQLGGDGGLSLPEAIGRERAAMRAEMKLAEGYARELGRPACIIVRGLSGTGKSTLAAAIADRLGFELLQTDVLRRKLFPMATTSGYGQACYTTAARRMVYDALMARARESLSEGLSVVLDGTFLAAEQRVAAAELAARQKAAALVISCHCPIEVAQARVAQRAEQLAISPEITQAANVSDARLETLLAQQKEDEPNPPALASTKVDTTLPLEEQLSCAVAALAAQLKKA